MNPRRPRLLMAAGAVGLAAVTACAPGSNSSTGASTPTPGATVSTNAAGMGKVNLIVWDQEVRGGQDGPDEPAQQGVPGQVPEHHDQAGLAARSTTSRRRCGWR